MPRMVAPDQPRASKASLAAVTIASRGRAAAAARRGASYARFRGLTGPALALVVLAHRTPRQLPAWHRKRRRGRSADRAGVRLLPASLVPRPGRQGPRPLGPSRRLGPAPPSRMGTAVTGIPPTRGARQK